MSKDWNGGFNSVFKCLGASSHTEKEREPNDYYATSPEAIDLLFESNNFVRPKYVWECACGEGHLAKRLADFGCNVYSSDLIYRGFGTGGVDFLKQIDMPFHNVERCIVTNPPYKYAMEFVLHALDLLKDGERAVFFLKTSALEGKKRYEKLFKPFPPKMIYQFKGRVVCAKMAILKTLKRSAVRLAMPGLNGSKVIMVSLIYAGYNKKHNSNEKGKTRN